MILYIVGSALLVSMGFMGFLALFYMIIDTEDEEE